MKDYKNVILLSDMDEIAVSNDENAIADVIYRIIR
jgi:hypothetical protein